MAKIAIEDELICQVFTEAELLKVLPRKKKKALKKKISRGLIDIALAQAELYIYNKTHEDLITELHKVLDEFEKHNEKL
jgi:hypothetical protein